MQAMRAVAKFVSDPAQEDPFRIRRNRSPLRAVSGATWTELCSAIEPTITDEEPAPAAGPRITFTRGR